MLLARGNFLIKSLLVAITWIALGSLGVISGAQVDCPTEHFNNQRSGENPNETVLTPTSVQTASFGKLFGFGTPGFGQPVGQILYAGNVNIAGGTHNVIYTHDGVYLTAYDADAATNYQNNPYYWHVQLATSGAPWNSNAPALDRTNNAIYVIEAENGGAIHLNALDLGTGAHKAGSPVSVQVGTWAGQPVANTIAGTGQGSSGGRLPFPATVQNCRPAMLVDNNTVWMAFSRNGDGPHGWVFAYDATTLAQQGAFCVTPNGSGGGIWQANAGLAADANHNVYFCTGNGTFDANTGGSSYGMCFLKVHLASPLNTDLGTNIVVGDWFSPYNEFTWSQGDSDIGSTGVILIPGTNKLVSGGTKYGFMYLLEYQSFTAPATNMGHFDSSGTSDHQTNVQSLPTGAGSQALNGQNVTCWDGPSGKYVYHWAPSTTLKAYKYDAASGKLNATPDSQNSLTAGGYTCVTSNAGGNAILWTISTSGGQGLLRALNPADVSQQYWSSDGKSNDNLVQGGGWQYPMAVNGKVYAPTYNGLTVYGMSGGTPVFTSVSVSPTSASVVVGGTRTFTATALDQNGTAMSSQPTFTWSVSGGGTISAGGVFTAGGTPAGPFTVTAQATIGGVTKSGTASVTVSASIRVAPTTETVAINTSYTFTAVAVDPGGNPLATQPTFTWSVSGGGAINSSGVFTAGGTTGGPFTITANASGSTGTASVLVTASPYGMQTRGALTPYLNGTMPTTGSGTLPATLSATGAFTSVANLTPAASLVPYTVNTPLWSDAALKQRWTALATGATVTFAATGEWTWPNGTVFVKHFELGTNDTNPAVRQRLETRLLVRDSTGAVYGATYKWRADNSDADLVAAAGDTATITIATAGGGTRTQTWYFPSRTDCLTCHTTVSGGVLGVKSRQLNGNFAYPSGTTDNQLRTWNHLNMFSAQVNEANIAGYAKLSAVDDTSASLQQRARSYLDANCFGCHQPGGASPSTWDARYDTPIGSQGIIDGAAVNGMGVAGAHIVTSGSTAQSVLYLRINSVPPTSTTMPPIGRHLIDTVAVQEIANWINSLSSPPTVATAAAANPNPVTGTTTALSVLGGDNGGEAALTYTWATTGTPPAAVTFSANGTNAAKATTATFTKAGSYTFSVTIRDPGGLTVTSSVVVTVNQTLTTITVAPATASIAPNATQPFTAAAKDQFGNALTTTPTFTWTVSGGGTISSAGLFTAGAAAGGPFTVTAASGGHSGTASVTVTAAAPTIASFTPTSGLVGATVTITGTGFTGATAVKFNGTAATTFTVVSATSITAVVPAGATTGKIAVTTPGGTATSAGNFTVLTAPTITSFTPASGGVGATVTVTGTGFTGATAVKFNGTSAGTFTVVSTTSITAVVPAGATTGTIAITTPGGTATSAANFTVVAPPTITSVSPTSGNAGVTVTITGTNLGGVTAVTFNGTPATFAVNGAGTQITTTVPAGASSGTIAVTTPGGTATSTTTFTTGTASTASASKCGGGLFAMVGLLVLAWAQRLRSGRRIRD